MTRHRSTAYIRGLYERYAGSHKGCEPITPQFRFIVRLAYACHERNVPYDVAWNLSPETGRPGVTITATGDIPTSKPLPKAPKLKVLPNWKPTIWEAVYRLDVYHDSILNRRCPGFAIEHSCGLSLVHPSESGELGGDDEDIRQRWFIIHSASGKGFGLTLNFKRATDALLLAASFAVDWTQDVEALKGNPEFRRAGYTVQAAYSTGYEKESAKRRLAEMERAA